MIKTQTNTIYHRHKGRFGYRRINEKRVYS